MSEHIDRDDLGRIREAELVVGELAPRPKQVPGERLTRLCVVLDDTIINVGPWDDDVSGPMPAGSIEQSMELVVGTNGGLYDARSTEAT